MRVDPGVRQALAWEHTHPARTSGRDLDLVFQDVLGAVEAGGSGVLLNVAFPDVSNDPQPKSDAVAFDEGFIAGALMDGDMSASDAAREDFVDRVRALDDGSGEDEDD